MKKMILSLCGLATISIASAQLSVGAYTNYTMYKGNVGRNAAGFGVRAAYQAEKNGYSLSFTNGMPMKYNTTTYLNSNTSAGSTKEVAAEQKLTFRAIQLAATRTLIGDEESTGRFYGGVGAGFVLASYSETITGSYDKTAYSQMEGSNGSENGFTLNVLAGGEYKLGMPTLFAEAGIALPANKVNDQYVANYIPAHFMFNVGVKFQLGGE